MGLGTYLSLSERERGRWDGVGAYSRLGAH